MFRMSFAHAFSSVTATGSLGCVTARSYNYTSAGTSSGAGASPTLPVSLEDVSTLIDTLEIDTPETTAPVVASIAVTTTCIPDASTNDGGKLAC